ncbi:hypothetical protein DEVEQU_02628 [Devosia equisanguinis]|uniref:DUF218 domain-containing protein n=1 Tax=Devosia equisanguinis TaxID=2490941 RepID=A0A447IDB6_9HYPH|nr:YdcF family protein [Devosia equisanguinis]VDS05486.1 hypothetical protein DEVEQU_02628 [Devosia equisanguinis]
MFFVLSKVFWLLAQPLSIVLVLLACAIVLLFVGRRKLAIALLVPTALVHTLTSFTSFGYVIIQPLEARFSVPETMPENVATIIVLGGATLARPSTARQTSELNEAGDRLTTALWLARFYPEASLVLSGGAGLLDDTTEAEATTMQRFFIQQGIAPERLVLEEASRNTDENSAFTRDYLATVDGPAILVTSAFHMPRSMGLFRKQGLDLIAWPTDYRSSGREGFGFDIANPVNNLSVTTVAMKEWIGLVVYHWTGRTADLLPSP